MEDEKNWYHLKDKILRVFFSNETYTEMITKAESRETNKKEYQRLLGFNGMTIGEIKK